VVAVGARAAGLAGERVRIAVDAASTIRCSPSVIGETGAAGARRVLMAGGHLDSVPEGPGLNDNGSGVAALLEIAEELGGRRVPDGMALRFAFWGAEEIGLVGSRRYVDGLSSAERRRIAAYLSLDMVGSRDAEPRSTTATPRSRRACVASSGPTRHRATSATPPITHRSPPRASRWAALSPASTTATTGAATRLTTSTARY
jgi:Zn-dependent M28 family amino/carboxypeptidase